MKIVTKYSSIWPVLLQFYIVAIIWIPSETTDIHCNYNVRDWPIVKKTYHCSVDEDPEITSPESAIITSMSENHQIGKSNSDIEAFHVSSKTFNYLPRDLDKFFKNLLVIDISDSKVKEVHQEDFKPFTKLIQVFFYSNTIEVLEEGLFDFNPNLEYVDFNYNKIVHIDLKIFDHLVKLSHLYLGQNNCIDMSTTNSISEVKKIIQSVKSHCINFKFFELKNNLEKVDKELKNLNPKHFNEKLKNFETTFSTSKFSKFRPLSSKFDALKNGDLVSKVSKNVNDVNSLQVSLLEVKDRIKRSSDEFETTLNSLKMGQNKIIQDICTKESLNQLRDSQVTILASVEEANKYLNKSSINFENFESKIKILLNEQKTQHEHNLKNKSHPPGGKIIKEHLKNITNQFTNLKKENAEEFAQIKTELRNSYHKITIAIDERIKEVEKRILRKFEDILVEKLGNFTKN